MIPFNTGTAAVLSETMETSTAKIKMSPHMVDLLSSKVYTDKISAVIREITCNAVDSNIAAGSTNPVVVTFPTLYDQTFVVQDFGLGLSKEDVFELYMTYGASTKQSSNDFTGFMGIGSKAPFCYVDAFTVVSNFEGTQSIYSIFKNNGIPEVALMATSETDSCNGFTVKIPVSSSDTYAFQSRGGSILKYFREGLVDTNIDLEKEKKVIEGDGYFFAEGDSYFSRSTVAIMGNVKYDVSSSEYGQHLIKDTGNLILHLEFENGELSPSASRESLSNDAQTKAAIIKKLEGVKEVLSADVEKVVSGKSNAREAYKLARLFKSIVNVKAMVFDGKTFREHDELLERAIEDVNLQYKIYTGYSKLCGNFLSKANTLVVDKVIFCLRDSKTGVGAFRDILNSKRAKGIMVDNLHQHKDICADLLMPYDSSELLKCSEIHVKQGQPKRSKKQIKVILKELDGYSKMYDLQEDLADIEEITYYVKSFRSGYEDAKGTRYKSLDNLRKFVESVVESDILVIPARDLKYAEKNSNLEFLDMDKLCDSVLNANGIHLSSFCSAVFFKEDVYKLLVKYNKNRFNKYIKLHKKYVVERDESSYKKIGVLSSIEGECPKSLKEFINRYSKIVDEARDTAKDIKEKYPFLNMGAFLYRGEEGLKYIETLLKHHKN